MASNTQIMTESPQHPLPYVRMILLDRGGRILLGRRGSESGRDGRWRLPGASVAFGDSPERAIVQSIKTETGLGISNLRFLFYQNSMPKAKESTHYINLYFSGEIHGPADLKQNADLYSWVATVEALEYPMASGGHDALLRAHSEYHLFDGFATMEEASVMQPWKTEDGTEAQNLIAAIRSKQFKQLPNERRREMVAELVELYLDINDLNSARKEMSRLRKSRHTGHGVLEYLEGRLATHEGDFSKAYQFLNQARRILEKRQTEDDALMARRLAAVYEVLGRAYLQDCSFSNALIWFERSLLLRVARKDRYGQARSYGFLRKLHEAAARYDRAIRYCQDQLAILRTIGDTFGECVAYNSLVDLYLAVNEPVRAQAALDKANGLLAVPHLTGSRPYVKLSQARLFLHRKKAREAYTRAAAAMKSFHTAGDLEREGGAYLVMAEARALEKGFGTASHLVQQAQVCFTKANLLRQRSQASLVECRILSMKGDAARAIAALCEALRLNYEYAGAARGEQYFRDVVQTFLANACIATNGPWVSMLIKTAGFWKFYHQRRNKRRLESGVILKLGDISAELEAIPRQAITIACGRSESHPWSGNIILTRLVNRGSPYGVIVLPESATAGDHAEMLADAGTALGAIYEKKLSQRDGLTDLYLRRLFDMALEEECSRCRVLEKPLAVIMLDIDHFGNFNKKYGHEVGDAVLSQVAAVFRNELRNVKQRSSVPIAGNECPARYGGEEFTALIKGCTIEETVRIAERIRANIEKLTISLTGEPLRVTASLGVGYCPPTADFNSTLKCADEAVRLAKTNGRNRVEIKECG
jgi:diguanylate cyclase (GGDEF)-like protein